VEARAAAFKHAARTEVHLVYSYATLSNEIRRNIGLARKVTEGAVYCSRVTAILLFSEWDAPNILSQVTQGGQQVALLISRYVVPRS